MARVICGVFRRGAAPQILPGAALQAEVLGGDGVGLEPAVLDLAHGGGGAHGDLIQLVLAVDHHAPPDPQVDEHLGQGSHQILVVHPQQLHGGGGRVGQGAQDVEHGAEAQLLADGPHVLHGGVVLLGEEEAHAHLPQQLDAPLRALLDVHPQGLQAVRRAALGGGRPVAVLGHLHAACRRHQAGGGGDIEAVGVVAAGAHDLKDLHARVHLGGVVPHGGGAAGDLVGGLRPGALGGEGRQERGVLGGSGLAAHDLVHDGVGLVVGQVLLVDDLYNGFLDHILSLQEIFQDLTAHGRENGLRGETAVRRPGGPCTAPP